MTEQDAGSTVRGADSAVRAARYLDRLVLVIAGAVATIAGAALLGWATGQQNLRAVLPGWAPMESTTAVALLVLAVALAAQRPWIVRGCCGVVAALGGTTLVLDATGPGSGGPATCTALFLLLLAVGGLTSAGGRPAATELVLVVGGAIPTIAELNYWYGTPDARPLDTMGLNTAICGTLVCIGWLGRVRDGHTRWLFSGNDAGAHLLRRILPAALFAGPLAGVLLHAGQSLGLNSPDVVLSTTVETAVLAILVVALRSATQIRRMDEQRQATMAELREVNRNLEGLAQRRAEHLARAQARGQTLAERERIAHDVHERVIGQIFLSSMQLARVLPMIGDAVTASAVAQTMDDLDETIRTIRNVIHPRGMPGPHRRQVGTEVGEPAFAIATARRADGPLS